MKSVFLALISLVAASSGLEGGLRDERDLGTIDCGKIVSWKLYYPGDVTYWPVPEKNVPGNMRIIKNGTCVKVSETANFNFMMYTLDWKPECGATQPECGRFKLYNVDTKTIIQRSGKEVGTSFFALLYEYKCTVPAAMF